MQINRTLLDDAWEPPRGIAVFVETPFYFGTVQAGVEILSYGRRNQQVPDFPDFNVQFFFLDWRAQVHLPWKLRLSNGFRFGLYQFLFDDKDVSVYQRVERELCACLVTGIQHDFSPKWTVRMTASYGTVYLSEPLRQAFVSVSFSRSFVTPEWLRDLLK